MCQTRLFMIRWGWCCRCVEHFVVSKHSVGIHFGYRITAAKGRKFLGSGSGRRHWLGKGWTDSLRKTSLGVFVPARSLLSTTTDLHPTHSSSIRYVPPTEAARYYEHPVHCAVPAIPTSSIAFRKAPKTIDKT